MSLLFSPCLRCYRKNILFVSYSSKSQTPSVQKTSHLFSFFSLLFLPFCFGGAAVFGRFRMLEWVYAFFSDTIFPRFQDSPLQLQYHFMNFSLTPSPIFYPQFNR